MRKSISVYIARKLSLATEGRHWSPSVILSVVAVALSLSVMLAAVCIVTGFKKEITSGVAGFNSHITLFPDPNVDEHIVRLTPTLRAILDNQSYIFDYSLETSTPAVFKTPEQFNGIYIRGINNPTDSSFFASKLTEGRLPDFSSTAPEVLLSEKTASALNVAPGDTIDTFFMGSSIAVRRYKITGTYASHFEYDANYAFLPIACANEMIGLSAGEGTDIRIITDNLDKSDFYASQLDHSLSKAYDEGDIFSRYAIISTIRAAGAYFNWLSLLDTNVLVILILMTAVAAITLISAMLIMIGEKTKIIGILRALGANVSTVRRIFVILACRVCLLGLLLGNALTLTFLMLEDKYHFVHLDPEAYYIDFMPVSINPWFVVILNVIEIAVVFLLLLLPARSSTSITPAEAMSKN